MIEKQYVLGVDGGGTKTAYKLADFEGTPVASFLGPGISYLDIGFEKVLANLRQGRDKCLNDVGANFEAITAVCIGLPGFEEFPENDKVIGALIRQEFSPAKILIVNDTEVAWAGSLNCQPGINVVAGTGSISFGRNQQGEKARCGGWSIVFGDEGSGYKVGLEAMSLFSKQADGRKPKEALYHIVKKEFALENDFDFISIMHEKYIPYRDKVASFQLILKKAAEEGDFEARKIYQEAAEELAMLVKGVRDQLGFSDTFLVSYSGGMFKNGDFLLSFFKEYVQAMGGESIPPIHSQEYGAVLMALNYT